MWRNRARFTMFTAGVACGVALSQTFFGGVASARVRKPARVAVALKEPLTQTVIRELRRAFGNKLLLAPVGGSYALVLLRPGETLADVQRRTHRMNVNFVDPELAMGAARGASSAAIVLRAPKPVKEQR